MSSKATLLLQEADILQEQMAIRDSTPPPSYHHQIITWWMLSFLTRSKACFKFCNLGHSQFKGDSETGTPWWNLKLLKVAGKNDEKFTQTSLAYLADYNFPLTFIDNALLDFNYEVNESTTDLPEIYLKSVEQPKLGYLKLPQGGCSGAKYVALIKTSYTEYARRSMMRKMFKSQLKDDEYDLFFLIGFKKNQFHQNFTSQQLVEKDKAVMKELGQFNDLGKFLFLPTVMLKKLYPT